MTRTPRLSGIDGLLVLMVLIWGVNYSVIKRAFEEIPPQPFNALRLLVASSVFIVAMVIARRRWIATKGEVSPIFYRPQRLSGRDWWDLVWLGLVGHFVYQFCFVGGVSGTSVSNAALIIGATPVVIAVISAALGRERITRLHWAGAAVSAVGIYFVVGHAASFGGATLHGDMLVMVSVACWAVYTLGATRLIARHSPLFVTGMTMVVGGVPYAIAMLPAVVAVPWRSVSAWTYAALVLSALLALCLSYFIWYTAVQKIGAARTSIYSNVVPIAAMAVAWVWLGEPMSLSKVAGAGAVLSGVFLTRLGRRPLPIPVEE